MSFSVSLRRPGLSPRPAFAVVFCVLLFAAVAAQAQQRAAIPPLDSPVVDTTGTLDAGQKQALEQQALALQRRRGSQLQVLIVPSTQPETIEQYSIRTFDQWQLGRKGVDDGVLLLVAKDDRRVRIEPGRGLEGAIPDAIANRIIQEYLVPKFREGDFGGGISDATAALVKLIDGEPLPEPMVDTSRSDEAMSFVARFIGPIFIGIFIGAFLSSTRLRPTLLRCLGAGGVAAAIVALVLGGLFGVVLSAVIAFLIAGISPASGRFVSGGGSGGFPGGWGGGGGWDGGGGWGGSSSGGGWSGGGGTSSGGGASGSW